MAAPAAAAGAGTSADAAARPAIMPGDAMLSNVVHVLLQLTGGRANYDLDQKASG